MSSSGDGAPVQENMANLRSSTVARGSSSTEKVDREMVMIVRNMFFSESGSVEVCWGLPKKLWL